MAALMACLVLASFDSFCGDALFPPSHIQFGRKILSVWRARQKLPRKLGELHIEDRLAQMFNRLDLQIPFFTGTKSAFTEDILEFCEQNIYIPKEFSNPADFLRVGAQCMLEGNFFYLQNHHY